MSHIEEVLRLALRSIKQLQAEVRVLTGERDTLKEWKTSALIQLGAADKLMAVLPTKYLGQDVHDAAIAEISELRSTVERLTGERDQLSLDLFHTRAQRYEHIEGFRFRGKTAAELTEIIAANAGLRSTVERLEPYARHKIRCNKFSISTCNNPCDCGFEAVERQLAELRKGS